MKMIKKLYFLLLLTSLTVGTTISGFSQGCTPPHISYSIVKTTGDIFEVYLTSDKVYNFPLNLVSNSTLVGLTFPAGYSWTGGPNAFLNVNGNQGNGNWSLGNLAEEPSCGMPNTDYVYAFMSNNANLNFSVAGVPILIFTFELPAGEPCVGDLALLENTDPYVVNNGCGVASTANFVSMLLGEGLCNNYAGNINNNGIDCSLAPLPVELMEFRAVAEGSVCRLNWATGSEHNNKGFEVQRRDQENRWKTLGWVEGNGFNSQVGAYQFIDRDPRSGTNYYRLEQFDFDGQSEYSPVRAVSFERVEDEVSLFPNPSMGKIHVRLPEIPDGKVQFMVLDVNRHTVYEQVIDYSEVSNYQFDFSELPAAVYLLHIRYPGAEEYVPFVLTNE